MELSTGHPAGPFSEYGRLDGQVALLEPARPELMEVEGAPGSVADEFGHSLPRRQRVHDAVAAKAGALDEGARPPGMSDDRLVIRSLRIQAGPALSLVDRHRLEEREPVSDPLGYSLQETRVECGFGGR